MGIDDTHSLLGSIVTVYRVFSSSAVTTLPSNPIIYLLNILFSVRLTEELIAKSISVNMLSRGPSELTTLLLILAAGAARPVTGDVTVEVDGLELDGSGESRLVFFV